MRPHLQDLAASGPDEAEKQVTIMDKLLNGKFDMTIPRDVLLKMVNTAGTKPAELLDPEVEYIDYDFCMRMGMKEAQSYRLIKARDAIRDGNVPSKTRR
jgi:hypothetical protein